MRNGIIKTTALVLGLGFATGVAYAQTDTAQPKLQDQGASGAAAKTDKAVSGQAGADVKAGGSGASAQAGGQAGAATQGTAGAAASGQADTTAQGGSEMKKDSTAASGQTDQSSGSTAQGGSEMKKDSTAASGQNDQSSGSTAQGGSDTKTGDAAASGSGTADTTAQGEAGAGADKQDSASGNMEPSSETTASVDISTEQQTELRTVFTETKVEPVADVDFTVSIGTAIPQTIELHPLPPRVVEIVPVYRDYEYFVLADGRIVIVEPATFEIVYILTV